MSLTARNSGDEQVLDPPHTPTLTLVTDLLALDVDRSRAERFIVPANREDGPKAVGPARMDSHYESLSFTAWSCPDSRHQHEPTS
jgi:hypothetical protein